MLCDATNWGHLPEAGGWYDQNPELVDSFYYILAERSKHQEAERAKQEAEARNPGRMGASRGPRARRR